MLWVFWLKKYTYENIELNSYISADYFMPFLD